MGYNNISETITTRFSSRRSQLMIRTQRFFFWFLDVRMNVKWNDRRETLKRIQNRLRLLLLGESSKLSLSFSTVSFVLKLVIQYMTISKWKNQRRARSYEIGFNLFSACGNVEDRSVKINVVFHLRASDGSPANDKLYCVNLTWAQKSSVLQASYSNTFTFSFLQIFILYRTFSHIQSLLLVLHFSALFCRTFLDMYKNAYFLEKKQE